MGVFAFVWLERETPGDLAVAGGKFLAQTADEAQLVFIVGKQVFLHRSSPTMTKCDVPGGSTVSNVTGSGAGSICSRASTRKRIVGSVSSGSWMVTVIFSRRGSNLRMAASMARRRRF